MKHEEWRNIGPIKRRMVSKRNGILRISVRDSVHNSVDRCILTETGNFPCSLLVYSHYPTSMWHPLLRITNGAIEARRPIAISTALIVISMGRGSG